MQSRILSGWKDIAKHLGQGVRTVQRYERELGLPIRRPGGKTTGSVLAVKAELDAWVASRRSVASICVSLKSRMTEMDEIANHAKELISEIRTSYEMLRNPVRQIHNKVKSGKALR